MFAISFAGIIAVVTTIWIGRADQASNGQDVHDAIAKMAAIATEMQNERPLLQQQVAALSVAANAANRNAAAAQSAMEFKRRELVDSAAGSVILETDIPLPFGPDTPNQFKLTVKNTGNTEIHNAKLYTRALIGTYIDMYKAWYTLTKEDKGALITIGSNQTMERDFYLPAISRSEFEGLSSTDRWYIVMAKLIYVDRAY